MFVQERKPANVTVCLHVIVVLKTANLDKQQQQQQSLFVLLPYMKLQKILEILQIYRTALCFVLTVYSNIVN